LSKTAITAAPIAPVLADRWSPRAFEATFEITQHDLLSVLEAGRWAPSANNAQPWFFSAAKRGDELFERISSEALEGFNASWAPKASAYIVVSALTVSEDGRDISAGSIYDAGLATMSMVVQAEELELATHQVGGFNRVEMPKILGLKDGVRPVVLLVVGKLAAADTLEGPAYEREIAPRVRKTLDEIVLHGKP
jgi:nitroreductase